MEWLEKNATLACGADAFTDEIINKLDALDAEFLDNQCILCNFLYNFDDISEFNEDDFVSLKKVVQEVKDKHDVDLFGLFENLLRISKEMSEVILGARLLLDKGYSTLGQFGSPVDDPRQKFVHVNKFVRNLNIEPNSQDKLLLSLAGVWAQTLQLEPLGVRIEDDCEWGKGSMTIFDFKLNEICNDEYSPVLKNSLKESNRMFFEYNRLQFLQNKGEVSIER